MASWQAAQVKERLDDLIREAQEAGPQTLVGESGIAIVVSLSEWERRKTLPPASSRTEPLGDEPQESLADFLLKSPLAGSGIEIERIKGNWRELDL